jgi:hypothetical protein
MQQPVFAVDAFVEASDLGTDVSARDLVVGRSVDAHDTSAAQGDSQRACIGAIKRTRSLDV